MKHFFPMQSSLSDSTVKSSTTPGSERFNSFSTPGSERFKSDSSSQPRGAGE